MFELTQVALSVIIVSAVLFLCALVKEIEFDSSILFSLKDFSFFRLQFLSTLLTHYQKQYPRCRISAASCEGLSVRSLSFTLFTLDHAVTFTTKLVSFHVNFLDILAFLLNYKSKQPKRSHIDITVQKPKIIVTSKATFYASSNPYTPPNAIPSLFPSTHPLYVFMHLLNNLFLHASC